MGIDAEIAAFIAAESPTGEVSDESDAHTDDGAGDGPKAPDESGTETAEESASSVPPVDVDAAAVTAAIKAKDVQAFLKALGPHAEDMLGSKAHKALRIAAKNAEKAAEKASKKDADAHELVQQLAAKYGDPIAARKAAEEGDTDAFVTLVEKWSGRPWNDTIRWVTQGIAGRKERLESRAREEAEASRQAAAKKEQAVAEARKWADDGVKRLAPELHHPDVVDMVMAEIRAGYSQGITTPAKALPLVRKKLEEQYGRLKKVFDGGRGAPPKKKVESPAARASRSEGGATRPRTLDEEIAAFVAENGLR